MNKDMVKWSIEPQPTALNIEDELGFEFTGADHSEYIKKVQDDNGANLWLWCDVKVTGKIGALEASTYLGACAYENEADFIKGGYYEQMQDEVMAELKIMLFEINQIVGN